MPRRAPGEEILTLGGGADGAIAVKIIRSTRRKKSIQASVVDDMLVVRVPYGLSRSEELRYAEELHQRLQQRMARARKRGSDEDLQARAERLNRQVLQGRARMSSIRWVGNQNSRWGSCSQTTGTIRISDKLRTCPDYVIDAVVVHELAHTFCAGGHDAEFWSWADRAPQAERAKGYLEGYGRALRMGLDPATPAPPMADPWAGEEPAPSSPDEDDGGELTLL
ncbi:hypothetical protein C1Y63_06305 [Corynebacterium sp. 13CS0277]|nr:hypothetical protein C1Y63_06305 [Corynebacterium sp. 13CS0277]